MQHMGHVLASPIVAEGASPLATDTQQQNEPSEPPMVGTHPASPASTSTGGADQPDYTTKAVLAKYHNIPFYVAAPRSTFDLSMTSGDAIQIEQRKADEIMHGFGRQTAPSGIDVYNPAFDVTPAELISAIITERGIISPVCEERVRAMEE